MVVELVTLVELKLRFDALGKPLNVAVTCRVPVRPSMDVNVKTVGPVAPWTTLMFVGFAVTEKVCTPLPEVMTIAGEVEPE